jgi:hypothetical protein
VLNCPGPVANQESQSRGVVIEIQQKIAGLLRVQGLSGPAGQVEGPPAPGPVLPRNQGVRPHDTAGPFQAGITSDLQRLARIHHEDVTSGDLGTAPSVFADDCQGRHPYRGSVKPLLRGCGPPGPGRGGIRRG